MKIFSVRVCTLMLSLALFFAAGCTKRDTSAAPAEEAAPVEETAPAEEIAPAAEAFPTVETAPVEESVPEEPPVMPEEAEKLPEPVVPVITEEQTTEEPVSASTAVDLTGESKLLKKIIRNSQRVVYYGTAEITDGDYYTGLDFLEDQEMAVYCATPFRYLYITWWEPPCPYYIKLGKTDFMTNIVTYDEEKTLTRGENGVLHELVRLPEDTNFAYLITAGEARLADIRVFSDGDLPGDIQQWKTDGGEADALIFADRAGDEAAYFGAAAALLAEENATVQFCYLFGEFGVRMHEMLDVLWSLGVRNYPILGPFPNAYVKNMARAQEVYEREDLLTWQVGLLRQYRPLVVLGHDRQGENGDFIHILSASALEKAVALSGDSSCKTGDAAPWEVPKLYLHMAEENPIVLDVETPLSSFGGKTAVQTAKAALGTYARSSFERRDLLDVSASPDAAVSVAEGRYDCRRFGLVWSSVGKDSGNDLLEHTENRR